MICLFLDTSSSTLIVSLVKDSNLLFEKKIESLRDHSSYLAVTVDEALKNNNLTISDLNKVFVGIGPGSFTGTRIAITFAKTICYAKNIDLIPVSSLEQFIYSFEGYDYYVPIIKERSDKLYFSIFDKEKNRIIEDSYSNEEELNNILKKYDGKMLIISEDSFYDYETKKSVVDSVKLVNNLKDRKSINPHILKPNYIKRIEVEDKL